MRLWSSLREQAVHWPSHRVTTRHACTHTFAEAVLQRAKAASGRWTADIWISLTVQCHTEGARLICLRCHRCHSNRGGVSAPHHPARRACLTAQGSRTQPAGSRGPAPPSCSSTLGLPSEAFECSCPWGYYLLLVASASLRAHPLPGIGKAETCWPA